MWLWLSLTRVNGFCLAFTLCFRENCMELDKLYDYLMLCIDI